MTKLFEKIDNAASETDFSGVISIFKEGSALFSKAYGYRDIKNLIPNSTGTLFGIASGTKLFTALGTGVLIDRGMLCLETKASDISPDYGGFIDKNATILHLLTHTSGIFDYYDEEKEQDFDKFSVEIPWSELETPSDYFSLFEGKTPKFKPGDRYSYSNGGYVFLGIIIEKITGELFRDFICENVLEPAKMNKSGFYAFNDLPENTANGYLENRKTSNIYSLPVRGGGDGGMYTTSDDLCSFWSGLFSRQILSEELTAKYISSYHRFNTEFGYGCGIYKKLDESMYFIVGGDAGVGFDSRYLLKEKLTINILSNITNGEEDLREAVLSIIKQKNS